MNNVISEKIKVLFFISSLAGGGAERVMVEILHYLDKSKIEPVLVLLYPYQDSPYLEKLPSNIKIRVVHRKSDSPFQKIKQLISFIKVVCNEKPNTILSMLTHNNIMAIIAGIILNKKIIVSEHSTLSEVIKTKEGARILGLSVPILVKRLYKHSHKIIAVSEGIKSDLVEQFSISQYKIEVIYNPLDLKNIYKASTEQLESKFIEDNLPYVIAMGRLIWQKGFDILIKTFSRVLREFDSRLLILGEGPEREALEKLCKDLRIADNVHLIGFQKNPYKFLSKADVFVLSSYYEGLPMVILEAMACGAPVIATDCKSGPREILDNGKYGILVPTGDVDSLAEAILLILNDKRLQYEYSVKGKERANFFSAERIIKQYEDLIYDSTLR